MTGESPIGIWDADNHLYEAVDAYTRYLPKRYRGAVQWVEIEGRTKLMIKGKLTDTIPNPTYEVVPSPGAWADYFKGNNPEGKSLRELANPIRCPPEFRQPDERLALLDRQGVDGCVLFPTTGGMLEERMKDDVELTDAVVHAYNEWLLEDWTFSVQDRIFPTPVITLADVERAVGELDWVLGHGARCVLVNPRPVATASGQTRSIALPHYDPFWARVQEAGIPVLMHACDSGYDRYTRDWEGGGGEYLPFQPDAFRTIVYEDARSIFDTCAALVAHGLFERNPGVRIGVVENGGAWVPRLFDVFDRVKKKMPGEFREDPIEQFKRHIWVNPFHEDDLAELVDLVGADRVMFGSDFPHPEGLAEPGGFFREVAHLGPEVTRQIMGANLEALLEPKPYVA
jgi:predicted TIM-barrel fold metal-dependent hydrolase